MDMVKIGAFLAELRKEHKLTQAELGERLGVSNKTVSRWETGTYLPPVEMLQELSSLYSLSINELISGERLDTAEYVEKAEENIVSALGASAFTLKEKVEYFRGKWLREHLFNIAIAVIIWVAVLLIMKWQGVQTYITAGVSGILTVILYAVLNNQMMSYVERIAYDGKAGSDDNGQ